MRQYDLGIRDKIPLLQDTVVVEPSRRAFDAALGFAAIGDLGRDVGQRRALPPHDAAHKRGQCLHVSGEVACGWRRRGLHEGMTDGTITAKVVTHRRRLLLWWSSLHDVDDEPTFLKCLF